MGIKKMSKYHLDNHLRTLHHNTHLHLQQPGSCAHPTKEKNIYKTQNPNEIKWRVSKNLGRWFVPFAGSALFTWKWECKIQIYDHSPKINKIWVYSFNLPWPIFRDRWMEIWTSSCEPDEARLMGCFTLEKFRDN